MKYDISFELFKEVNTDLSEEEIKYCFDCLKYGTVVNSFFFKCFEHARSKEMFLNVTDYQHYYVVSIKDHENEYEPHPEFKSIDIKEAVINASEYIMQYTKGAK